MRGYEIILSIFGIVVIVLFGFFATINSSATSTKGASDEYIFPTHTTKTVSRTVTLRGQAEKVLKTSLSDYFIEIFRFPSNNSAISAYYEGSDLRTYRCKIVLHGETWAYIDKIGFIQSDIDYTKLLHCKNLAKMQKLYKNIPANNRRYEAKDENIIVTNDKYWIEKEALDGCLHTKKKTTVINPIMLSAVIESKKFSGYTMCEFKTKTTERIVKTKIEYPNKTSHIAAIDWAFDQLGQQYQPGSYVGWNGWCDKFVANTYGQSSSGYHTAYDHYLEMLDRDEINTNRDVPAGAFVFFAPTLDVTAGHVMLSIGGGEYISTDTTISRVGLDMPGLGNYLGWSWPNEEWLQ